MLDYAASFTNFSGVYPDILAINASGPATQDGTEFTANMINDSLWGTNQMILNHAGLTPNGVLESDAASQIKEAIWKGFGGFPGEVKQWHLDDDPGTTGHRCLFLNGQGILHANYPELLAAVYVGDANNAAVAAGGGFYYKASDAAGTTPDTTVTGVYLILPETRGYAPRGLDVAASVDPDGAGRYLGDIQLDAEQGHHHELTREGEVTQYQTSSIAGAVVRSFLDATSTGGFNLSGTTIKTDGVNGTPRIDSETRMVNFSTKFVVWY